MEKPILDTGLIMFYEILVSKDSTVLHQRVGMKTGENCLGGCVSALLYNSQAT